MITRKLTLLALLVFFIQVSWALPNDPDPLHPNKNNSIFDEFGTEKALKLTIRTDLQLLLDKSRKPDYQKARLELFDEKTELLSLEGKVRLRGKFRKRACDFPPVKIKIPKLELAGTKLNPEYNELKLVTHCLDSKQEGNDLLLREYLIYKMYNELTDNSYRVQLVEVTYKDTEGNFRAITRYGFLIESTSEMAMRLDGEKCDCRGSDVQELVGTIENRMAVFNYMIGNNDWSISMLRNIKLIKASQTGQLIPVAYDFDFSGWVNPPYAAVTADHGLKSIRDRIYLASVTNPKLLNETLNLFQRKKTNFVDIVKNFDLLNKRTKKDVLAYLDSFYQHVEQMENGKDQIPVYFDEKEEGKENPSVKGSIGHVGK